MIHALIAPALSAVLTTFSAAALEWPDESAVGVNAGIAPGKSGIGLFYAKGPNQVNLGVFYSIGGEVYDRTNVHTGLSYNLSLTDWGLYVATGLNLIYIVETSPYEETETRMPWEPLPEERGTAWRSHGIRDPELVFTVGEQFWFGHRSQFGLHADAGVAFPFGYDVSHDPYPVAGIGLSWRLLFYR